MGLFDKILRKKQNIRKVKIENYTDFWEWFLKHEQEFYKVIREGKQIEEKFFDIISPQLKKINAGYYFLAGMSDENIAELIITVDGDIRNIVFAEEIVEVAPHLPHWKFTALKSEMNIENINIRMGSYDFTKDNIFFYSNDIENYPDEIDLTFLYDGLTEENKKVTTNGTYIFLDNYLGELNFATQIDSLKIIGKSEAEKELVPIYKLKDFLQWREREFIEKYKGVKNTEEEDSFSILNATLASGLPLIAVVNTSLLKWDQKASYPWISVVKIRYNGEKNNGLPEKGDYDSLDKIEEKMVDQLNLEEGNLYIGRESADNMREVFFASKGFRHSPKVFNTIIKDHPEYKISFDLYKDKYWQSFERYNVS
ncbi:DUF695 domain-containing protein [Chryseobacterium sp.]|uniref:DUF695 domain-containing protein n=1 Tax=Chryseobacterium sp. TaxID=1871047 RepID=UPI0025BF94BE|nr:DUF695 domain-containing protein [Chryseobacterium sp.]